MSKKNIVTNDLEKLYKSHAGKTSDKWSSYLKFYSGLFEPLRQKPVRILEIGIQNGGSLEIWKEYFPKAELLVGCDIDKRCAALNYSSEFIYVVIGDANTSEIEQKISGISGNFDIIIDDGSHVSSDIVSTFSRYYPMLKPGGIFIAEDLHCSYWESFQGGLQAPFSSISFFKRLCDLVNQEHWGVTQSSTRVLDYFVKKYGVFFNEEDLLTVESVSFSNSICAVKKSLEARTALGCRVVVGQEAIVSEDPLLANGQEIGVSDESSNPWGPKLTSMEEIVTDYYEAAKRTAQTQAEIEQLKRSYNELLQNSKVLGDIAERSVKILRRPTRSYFVTRFARIAAKLPGLSNRRRQKFLRSANKRDPRRASNLLSERLNYFKTSVLKSSLFFDDDVDGKKLNPSKRSEPVDIIVCVHNALNDVRICLSSIIAKTIPPYRLIIVDDGSALETKEYLEGFALSQGALLLRNEVAGGYTKASNKGLNASNAPWVILLNSDVIVSYGWFDEMFKIGNSDPEIGIVGPSSNTASWQSAPELLLDSGDWSDNPLPKNMTVDDMQSVVSGLAPNQGIDLPFLNGFAFMIRRELIDEIGGFDEETFGAGYGEENDFCIRARDAGWKLVFAPNAYVFHAQSKSYGSERRLKLAAAADLNLRAKHDAETKIQPQVSYCRWNLATLAFRSRVSVALEDHDIIQKYSQVYSGKRIAFVLPVGHAGGGANIIVQEASVMTDMGVDTWIINLESNKSACEEAYRDSNVQMLYFYSPREIRQYLARNPLNFDAIIATIYFTVDWLPEVFDSSAPQLGYYIQDFEPYFFNENSKEYSIALDSYQSLEKLKGFTKTNWNADVVAKSDAPRPYVVGASIDLDTFRPKGRGLDTIQRIRVAAMVRFDGSVSRRSPELTIRILNRLLETFENRIEIFVFGSEAFDPQKVKLSASITDLGILKPIEVATLLRNTDIFLDFSIWQAMGLSAMEAMASGCAVVVPERGGAIDFCRDCENALVIDTSNEEDCFEAAARLVTDPKLLDTLRQNATKDICSFTQHRSTMKVLDVMFGE